MQCKLELPQADSWVVWMHVFFSFFLKHVLSQCISCHVHVTVFKNGGFRDMLIGYTPCRRGRLSISTRCQP